MPAKETDLFRFTGRRFSMKQRLQAITRKKNLDHVTHHRQEKPTKVAHYFKIFNTGKMFIYKAIEMPKASCATYKFKELESIYSMLRM